MVKEDSRHNPESTGFRDHCQGLRAKWFSGKKKKKKNPPANAGDKGLISGSGRSPGEGNGNPLQHSYLENSMDRGAWWATVRGVAKELDTTEHNWDCACLLQTFQWTEAASVCFLQRRNVS